jgi:hypothetical protein
MTLSRWMYWLAAILVLAGLGYWFFGRAYTPAIRDSSGQVVPGSIASLEKIKLGGVEQWLVIRGHDTSNPVLLFLSGGPGASELSRVRYFSEPLEPPAALHVWNYGYCAGCPALNCGPNSPAHCLPGKFLKLAESAAKGAEQRRLNEAEFTEHELVPCLATNVEQMQLEGYRSLANLSKVVVEADAIRLRQKISS